MRYVKFGLDLNLSSINYKFWDLKQIYLRLQFLNLKNEEIKTLLSELF